MKISRKAFIKRSVLTATGLGYLPRIFGMVSNGHIGLNTRMLGDTGIEVTSLGFGASRTQEPSVLKEALDRGINFLDTGRAYAGGQNEVMIGKVLKGMRNEYVIQSKLKIDSDGESSESSDLRRQMETSLKNSLKALQTDYIDVMLLHGIEDEKILGNETIRKVFAEMKERGAIRACGFSSHSNHVSVLKEANKDHFFGIRLIRTT